MEKSEELIDLLGGFGKYTNIQKLIKLKKYRIANAEIDKILKNDPHDYTALLFKGICYEDEGKIWSAQKIFETAIKEDPNDERGHFYLGMLLADGIDNKKGIMEIKKAIELAPDNVEYKAHLAQIYYHLQETKKAKNLIEEAVKQDPGNNTVLGIYALIFDVSSDQMIKEYVKENPNDNEALNNLAVQYLEEGKPRQALEIFKRALSMDPNNKLYYNNYSIARKANMIWYRPLYHWGRFVRKHGMVKAYALWFGLIFLFSYFYAPLVLIMILFVVYTWVADPIANLILKVKK